LGRLGDLRRRANDGIVADMRRPGAAAVAGSLNGPPGKPTATYTCTCVTRGGGRGAAPAVCSGDLGKSETDVFSRRGPVLTVWARGNAGFERMSTKTEKEKRTGRGREKEPGTENDRNQRAGLG
jgi:hypothetical protein